MGHLSGSRQPPRTQADVNSRHRIGLDHRGVDTLSDASTPGREERKHWNCVHPDKDRAEQVEENRFTTFPYSI